MPVLETDLWLRGEDFGGKDVEVLVLDEGEVAKIRTAEGEREVFNLSVQTPEGEKRIWTANKMSQRTLATRWGRDTKNWVGKKVVLFATRQMVFDKEKWVIYARLPAA